MEEVLSTMQPLTHSEGAHSEGAGMSSRLVGRFSQTQIAAVGFGVALATVLAVGVVQYRAIQTLVETDVWVEHSYKVLFEIEGLSARLEAAKSLSRDYLVTGDESFARRYETAVADVREHLQEVRRLTSDNPRQQSNLDQFEPLVQRKLLEMDELIRVRRELGIEPASALVLKGERTNLMSEVRQGVDILTGEERRLLESRKPASEASARNAGVAVVLGGMLALGLIIIVGRLLYLSSRERLKAEAILKRQAEDLRQQAELLELAHDSIFVRDLKGIVTYWNRGAEETYGWTSAEALGKTSYTLLATQFPIPLPEIERQVHTHGRWEGELTQTKRDGRHMVLESRWGLIRDKDGKPLAVLEINRDVTDRRHLEAKFRGLLESAPDAIVVAGIDGRIVLVNAQAERIFGYSRKELLGENVELLVPDRSRGDHFANWAKLFAEPRLRSMGASLEFQGRRKDGSVFPLEIGLSPVKTEMETLVSSGIRDVTDRKLVEEGIRRLNEDLERRSSELEATNKELESFSYSVSHDLRAPLRAIDGFSQVLIEDYGEKLDSEAQKCLDRVRAATQRMGELIDCLLTLSRLSRQEVQRSKVDLSSLAGAIAQNLRQSDPDRAVDFVITPGAQAQCDRRLLEVALQNLMANAWKFTGKQPNARIEFGAVQDNGKPVFYVRDNGAGFDMAYASKLFGTFQRLHAQGEFEGHGIGLATVRRVISRHGGRIWAEGQVGKGATFSFTL